MSEPNDAVEIEAAETVSETTSRARVEVTASGGRLLLGWGLLVASLVLLLAGWWGVSGQPILSGQLSYVVSGGIGGLLAGIVGVGLLISNDVRKDRERLGRVEAAMLEIRAMLVAQAEEKKQLDAHRITGDAGVSHNGGGTPAKPRSAAGDR